MRKALAFVGCLLGSAPVPSAEPAIHIVVQHSALAGFRHYEGRSLWEAMRPGDDVALVREADNVYDPNAVRVEWRGHMVGYVPRRQNAHLARQLDRGVPLAGRITRLEKSRNGRNRVSYEILVPLE